VAAAGAGVKVVDRADKPSGGSHCSSASGSTKARYTFAGLAAMTR
jgi:hypothetical protein